ncbi:FAD binding domain-containing protein [Microbacterium sp. LRZ72]|uniref:FAD binding domain-containing protein n=1 Tax=Microbacterium sp. LRZ72 TaxID=2942481 RepID=UPI0029AC2D5A|nr:FAD binding domain-containing protein [Microbacterium sp. LRZ72]MDX2376313.1 FAD binding domain-containing protein [Microbacterium sp. LRZ72]
MDLNTVTSYRRARTRADLALAPGEIILGGGTWIYGEPQPETTGLVDVTTMGWPDLEITHAGLRVSATCTIATLVAFSEGRHDVVAPPVWRALEVIPDAANALLASFKIWNAATVGGNICRSYAAGSMVALAAGLDGIAVIWTPDGGERRTAVAELVTGNGTNDLAPGEVLRAVELPARALRARMVLRKIALAELGRSGAVVTARRDEDGAVVVGITAATSRPVLLRYPALPSSASLADDVASTPGYYTDPLGPADWRRAVTGVLAERVRADLAADEVAADEGAEGPA